MTNNEKLQLTDSRIKTKLEELGKLHSDGKITHGNTASYLIKLLEDCEPILNELRHSADQNIYNASIETFIRLVSTNANMGIKEVVERGQKNILVIKIQGLSHGETILEQYKYLFDKLSSIPKNDETETYFKKQKEFFLDAYNKLGGKGNSGGCYVATMAYGSYDHPQVIRLRNFRDNVLSNSAVGRGFIKVYYRYSPNLVEVLRNNVLINRLIRSILNLFIKIFK